MYTLFISRIRIHPQCEYLLYLKVLEEYYSSILNLLLALEIRNYLID